MVEKAQSAEHPGRVQVNLQRCSRGSCVRIEVEQHDEGLGWYTSGSVTLPLHQLPLLEQAIEEMRARTETDNEYGNIIPFPGMQNGCMTKEEECPLYKNAEPA